MVKRALITGLAGFVASHLAEYLLEHEDWDIYGLVRWQDVPCDNIATLVPRINKRDRVFLLYGDLRDTLSIDAAVAACKPDFLFHLAAQSYPQTSFSSPLDAMDTNAQGTIRVLDAVRRHCPECVVHVCSSSEVYGKARPEDLPLKETAPFHPASPYAISKVAADLAGQHYAEAYGMRVLVTRMFTHTGPRRGDVFAESSFAKQIALIEAGHIPPIVEHGNLASLRTIADVRDAVRAYHLLVRNADKSGVWNIGGTTSRKIGQVLHDLLFLSPHGSLIKKFQSDRRMRPIDADLQVPDCTKFKELTGWAPQISYGNTICDLLNYWRTQVKLKGGALLDR